MLYNFTRCLEKNSEYETDYLKILYYDLKKGYKGTYRSYEYNRICTIHSGSKHVTINEGSQFVYSPSEFILLPPHSSVEMDIPEDTNAIVFEISDQIVDKIKDNIQNKFDTALIHEDANDIKLHSIKTIRSQISRINNTLMINDPDKGFLIDLITQELVYHLIKNNFLPDEMNYNLNDPIEYTLKYMHTHIHEAIYLSDLANELNISQSSLSSKFKTATGFTPKEYFNMIKIKKSKDELLSKSVTEVCYSLGFENISYFINLFKKHYGETPKKYAMRMSRYNTNRPLR
ncbi:helix-turn-helix domain-containing protein [Marinisporobacter balticus]|uniref:AraC family transcriptional regulator n=1 Tax=Marinisporobacter balticus TaxID=2018667 RepID=A0A4R2L0T1_9FIRM|nr:helix-turn-helix domain-containing protein [Marinisporobacter balticus]TCO77399.1 AraC family transcriptional regulator [Marinisporobacter balticus]